NENKFLSQRSFPKMAMITPRFEVNDNGDISELVLSAKGVEKELRLPLDVKTSLESNDKLEVKIWNDVVPVYDCGKEASTWISSFLGTSATLVVKPDEHVRSITKNLPSPNELAYRPQVAFADSFPFLLISEESLTDLNSRLDSPVNMRNFRPNIVVKGCNAPYEEDTWKEIVIGEDRENIFYVTCRSTRCTVPNVNPDTGERKSNQPLKTLMSYRRVDKGAIYKACFGMNVLHSKPGTLISIGDQIEIISTGEHMREPG
ncbi:11140_t:CDS:2, partial [Paraglomus occultum]